MQIGGHLVWQQNVIDVDCLTNSHIITVVLAYIVTGFEKSRLPRTITNI